MGEIPFKVGGMIQPGKAPHTSHYVPTISRADGRIRNEHHSLLKQMRVNFHTAYQIVLSQSWIPVVTFHTDIGARCEACEAAHISSGSCLRLSPVQDVLLYRSLAEQSSKMERPLRVEKVSFLDTSVRRRMKLDVSL